MLRERQKEKEEAEKRRKSEETKTDEELWARLEELEVSIKRRFYIKQKFVLCLISFLNLLLLTFM